MKFLIAGLGSIGRRHLRNLVALGERDIVLYRTHRATLPDDELAAFPADTDFAAALDHKPDAVIIANPTALHLDVAIRAAEAGCNILIEKPISHSLDRVDELEAALKRGGGTALVGFQYRCHPTMRIARQLLADGAIGRPLAADVHFGEYLPAWHPWEDYRQGYAARADLGGGVILTQCHALDYLPWLIGSVESLWAFVGNLGGLGVDVDDTAEIGLRFTGGAIGSIHLNMIQQPPSHRWEIVGSAGTLRWENDDGILRFYAPHPLPLSSRSNTEGGRERGGGEGKWQTFSPPESFERNTMFIEEMRHFIQVVRGESEPLCTLEDGIYALRLALSALRSGGEMAIQKVLPIRE
jgi:predicted dehydrogenase